MKRFAFASLMALACLSVRADETTVDVPCRPLAVVMAEGGFRDMTHDEWIAARAIFWMTPWTPATFPPGDKGLIREKGDEADVEFVDGDEACAPIQLGKGCVEMLKALRNRMITHPEGRM